VCLLFLVVSPALIWAQDGPPAPAINQHFVDGVKMVREGRHQEAVTELQAAVNEDPDLGPAWHYLGVARFFLGSYEEADVLAQLGKVHEAAGQPHLALAAYSEAIVKDPNNFEAQRGVERLQAL
jgi:tetratricopeptide (TPR) repeat protein